MLPCLVGVAEAAVAIAVRMLAAIDGVEILQRDGKVALQTGVDVFEAGQRALRWDGLLRHGKGLAQFLLSPVMRDRPSDSGRMGAGDAFVDTPGGDLQLLADLARTESFFMVHPQDVFDSPGGFSHASLSASRGPEAE